MFINDLYYEKVGSGPNIVLLHGNGESHEIFQELIAELQPDFTVYAFDSPGHGLSHPVDEYHYAEMAAEIAAALREVLSSPALVVGFSDGGILALYLAMDHADVIAGIIPCGTNFSPDGVLPEWTKEFLRYYEEDPSNKLLKLMLTEPQITEQDLQRIQVPTLVLAGENDLIRPEHTEELHKNIAGSSRIIVMGEDHGSYIEHSAKLAPYIRGMAGRLWPNERPDARSDARSE